jgi:hypothetical protein
LLCDSAQSVGGKLYLLGAGWSQITRVPGGVSNIALAIKLSIPWDLANQRLAIEARLLTEDGNLVEGPAGPVKAGGELEVARGLGMRQGVPLDANVVMDFGGLDLEAGGYVFELKVAGKQKARAPFQVKEE